jgi:hypothetical protein
MYVSIIMQERSTVRVRRVGTQVEDYAVVSIDHHLSGGFDNLTFQGPRATVVRMLEDALAAAREEA